MEINDRFGKEDRLVVSFPIGSSVDRRGDKVDQILTGFGLGGDVLFIKYFSSAPSMYLL